MRTSLNIASLSAMFAFTLLLFASMPAIAQCLPGLPCIDKPTAGQLLKPHTGPNASKSGKVRIDPRTKDEDIITCDANFMNQIYAKAFLEAEREVIVSNSVFLKPDSVLEYSCFDQQVASVAKYAGPIFTETLRYDPAVITMPSPQRPVTINVSLGDTYLDLSLEKLVLNSLVDYIDANFNHNFLGGSFAGRYSPSSRTVAGAEITCATMFSVYFAAKCDDFSLEVPFLSFDEYFSLPALTLTDPRLRPRQCPKNHQITQAYIDIAKNKDWTYASFDVVDALLPIWRPSNGALCENAAPIPTGIMALYEENDIDLNGNAIVIERFEYEDKFCSNPACSYDFDANVCVP